MFIGFTCAISSATCKSINQSINKSIKLRGMNQILLLRVAFSMRMIHGAAAAAAAAARA
jgi:hypothetical protein